jgi:hypothetical protein
VKAAVEHGAVEVKVSRRRWSVRSVGLDAREMELPQPHAKAVEQLIRQPKRRVVRPHVRDVEAESCLQVLVENVAETLEASAEAFWKKTASESNRSSMIAVSSTKRHRSAAALPTAAAQSSRSEMNAPVAMPKFVLVRTAATLVPPASGSLSLFGSSTTCQAR